MIAHGAEPVEVGEHFFHLPHHGLQPLGNVIHLGAASLLRQVVRHALDDDIARVAHGVDRVTKTNHHLLGLHAAADVGLGLVGAVVAFLDLKSHLVRTAMLRAPQRANGAGDGRIHVAARACHHACGEGGCIELMLGIQVERRVHGALPVRAGFGAVQQVQEVRANGVVVGLHLDTAARAGPVVPVQQHGTE
ncbi:hypothetical protein D3C71_1050920 [compost metagenome]